MDNTALDRIRQKRQEQAANDAEAAKTQSVIDAIQSSGAETKDSVTSAMHDLLMATLVAKDPKVAEAAKSLVDLVDSINAATGRIQSVDMTPLTRRFESLDKTLTALPGRISDANMSNDYRGEFQKLAQAISSKNFSPRIQVDAPSIDVDPLKEILREQKTSDDYGLEAYRAQDIDEEEAGIQYVGFVSPNGAWYIIKNDEDGKSLRYKFGKNNYAKAWQKLSTFDYKLLDEAFDEVRS